MKTVKYALAVLLLGSVSAPGQTASPTPLVDSLQILEKVNSFYSSSFSHLVNFTFAIVTLLAVIPTIVSQIIQARTFRLEKETLVKQLNADVAAAKTELQTHLENTVKLQLDAVRADLTQQVAVVKGTVFFLQAAKDHDKRKYAYAASDYAYAARKFVQGKDDGNFLRSIEALLSCLPKLSNPDFSQVNELEQHLDELLKVLGENNTGRRYSDTIHDLKTGIAAAKERSKNPNLPTSGG